MKLLLQLELRKYSCLERSGEEGVGYSRLLTTTFPSSAGRPEYSECVGISGGPGMQVTSAGRSGISGNTEDTTPT